MFGSSAESCLLSDFINELMAVTTTVCPSAVEQANSMSCGTQPLKYPVEASIHRLRISGVNWWQPLSLGSGRCKTSNRSQSSSMESRIQKPGSSPVLPSVVVTKDVPICFAVVERHNGSVHRARTKKHDIEARPRKGSVCNAMLWRVTLSLRPALPLDCSIWSVLCSSFNRH